MPISEYTNARVRVLHLGMHLWKDELTISVGSLLPLVETEIRGDYCTAAGGLLAVP